MPAALGTRWYNAVWRWHFYAGIFCMPFVLWLAITGTIYLWKPQIESWLERPYDRLAVTAPRSTADSQVRAALAAVPGSSLHKFQLPQSANSATRVIVSTAAGDVRVYVDPYSLRVLKVEQEGARPMRVISDLHGTLKAGNWGSYLVEIAACWTVVMLLTGLYLWWPRNARGLGGILYPRLRRGRRGFWRDIHAVAGIWVAVFALFLISTGLPWAKFWGSYFQEVRQVTNTVDGPQDWPTGSAQTAAMMGDHAGHAAMSMRHEAPGVSELDRVIATAYPLGMAAPVMISPPARGDDPWTVASDAANRPLRGQATVDGRSGALLSRKEFAQRHWLDKVVGYGIAAHEGALFGMANQLLGTATALLLMTLSLSGFIMWWRRRPQGLLGAPVPAQRPRFGFVPAGAIAILAFWMPLFGATLLIMLMLERTVFQRLPKVRGWLGLKAHGAA
ncbi:PepSY-associated TM helix domain-containing protein [Sphingomonas sp. S2-65]|uniref:PepSY-associated TM helix domain-containing protein n=1 Tax=Sphingomonas sp. S2-65 TaxID=2903960 RepID=UPI001F445CC3|nr:PepSY domain-containing protein [Sphingomonas sp. S2-65]UYY59079.1 PepSY domain-containing protein [Sphingomonas sp. S2-65]